MSLLHCKFEINGVECGGHPCRIWRLRIEGQAVMAVSLCQADTVRASSPVAKHHGQRAEQVRDEEQPQRRHRPPPVHPVHRQAIHELRSYHLRRELEPPAAERIDRQLQPCQRRMPAPVPAERPDVRASKGNAAYTKLPSMIACGSCESEAQRLSGGSCASAWRSPADSCRPRASVSFPCEKKSVKHGYSGRRQSWV